MNSYFIRLFYYTYNNLVINIKYKTVKTIDAISINILNDFPKAELSFLIMIINKTIGIAGGNTKTSAN